MNKRENGSINSIASHLINEKSFNISDYIWKECSSKKTQTKQKQEPSGKQLNNQRQNVIMRKWI